MDFNERFPWTIDPCTGEAIQFLIKDRHGEIVMMSEMFDLDALVAIVALFQRNPEMRVSSEFEKQIKYWGQLREE